MNFTHLTSVYPDKSPLQIYEFLSTATGTYVDIACVDANELQQLRKAVANIV